jgi:hypothetical protein
MIRIEYMYVQGMGCIEGLLMGAYDSLDENHSSPKLRLKRLSEEQVKIIDEYLTSVGEYGEVHLIVQNGELRYINKVESHRAWANGKRSDQ